MSKTAKKQNSPRPLLPRLRFAEFRGAGEWEKKAVGDIFQVTRGEVLAMTRVKDFRSAEFPYPVYSSQTKNNGLAGYYSEYLYEDAITWTTDGANAGEVNFRLGKFYCTNVCGVLLNSNGWANSFVSALLNSVTRSYVSYVGNPKLMNAVMAKIVVPFPPLPEQQKIADCLSSLDTLITAEAQKLDTLKTHKKGLMQQLFPRAGETTPRLRFAEFRGEWERKTLGEFASFYKGKGLPKSVISAQGEFPCIHYGELFTEYQEVIDTVKSFTDIHEKTFHSVENDVLMPTSDVTPNGLAKACCIKLNNVILGGDILVIRTSMELISGEFLARYIRNEEKKVLQLVTGSTVFHLYASAIEKMAFMIPEKAEQQKIAACLSSLDDLITAQTQKVTALQSHKKGLMQQLFPAQAEASA